MARRKRSALLSRTAALVPAVNAAALTAFAVFSPLASASLTILRSPSPEAESKAAPSADGSAAAVAGGEATDTPKLDTVTTCLLLIPGLVGLLWAGYEAWRISKVKLEGPLVGDDSKRLTDPLYVEMSGNIQQQLHMMKSISKCIAEGAGTFLKQEFKYMAVYVVVFSAVLGVFINLPTMVAFVLGALTSILCGFVGMKIAVYANVRTCHEAWIDLGRGFHVALTAGSVMGFALVSLGVLTLVALILVYRMPAFFGTDPEAQKALFEAVAGYGLGGSSIALFARVGGGIYTKAADVGADLSGKNAYGMSEDDPRNPACIADNVGDNVGDVAGMGADLFGSLAEASCAGLVIAGASVASAGASHSELAFSWAGLMFPVLISSTGICSGIVTVTLLRGCCSVRSYDDVERALKWVMFLSTALETPVSILLAYFFLPPAFALDGYEGVATWWHAAVCVVMGLWAGLAIGTVTEYYTSHSYFPVREIAQTQIVSAATGIIYGLALGYLSTVVPILCLGVAILVSHTMCGMYGIALAALGMLSTLTMGLMIDGYGPISDNAGGIAEMAGLGADVRSRTDALDAAGNTTAAVGKGYAIGSAALVSLALFGAFTVRAKITAVDVLDPWTFTGLLIGAMMPYAFSAMTMKSVGIAANDMVQECLRQFPHIIEGTMEPQYTRCVAISTRASLHEMVAPGALVICTPIAAGMAFGKNCTAGLLAGALVSGILLAISASNSGGAWDNSKKYIESGALGPDHSKGSEAHKNAVTGDTVGDPLKDTSGPSLNILIKLSAIISLVFGSFIADNFSNAHGGPVWIPVQ
ncbi:V-type H(+)-translocating pyrophosphatase VP1 [Besnoitia besnoiti]|uniref:H(+)-exporting diphosphatase n=1 Tax=Besnoitia besnoiti TaxID=94643 RepID=A0A2A9MPV3_BESBE|nr:V-type H(+)-translocating pyrophosphatase VP1 [Besnoitia besnoiti]PFH38143.1 V-type H(+)-translocating pyrophosphatase VP1 [Besnoitia besnoiti]